jgi:cytochrome c oxidase subunit 2
MRRLLGLPEQASSVAYGIDLLHYVVIVTTMIGASAVGLAAVGFAIRYRRRPGDTPRPPERASALTEWGIVIGLLGLFVLWWWIGYRQYLRLQVPPPGAMEVVVSAKQWMWKFAYPEGRSSLGLLVVPVGRPVKLAMSSRDVIHGFFVPEFRIKHDVVPGTVSVTWFQAERPGTYQILCTQYCGTSHAKMRGAVVALPPADFAAWLRGADGAATRSAMDGDAAERRAATEPGALPPGDEPDLAEAGRSAAARHGCLSCHTTDGQRHIGPTWRGLYGSRVRFEDGRSAIADETYLTRSMMDPLAEVVDGYRPLMPSYQGLLDADDAAAIVEFIRSLRDGDPAAPANPPLPAIAVPGRP